MATDTVPIDSSRDSELAISVVIADDHPVMRSSLRMLLELEDDLEVVAEAGSVAEVFEHLKALEPDVLLLDIYMPGGPSLGFIPALRVSSPRTHIVVLTMQTSVAFTREAMRLGASGYVTKQAADREMVRAIHAAAHGERYVEATVGAQIAIASARAASPAALSERETEVLTLVALGYTNREIAEQLSLSLRTIESHRAHIQQKLKLRTRAALVGYALESGLLER
jgi:two-component system, NarL family, response regulator NreC